ncbi:putative membrane protein YkvI [Kroppenstedtia sanguinis]|uniref:Membrane protein YkvI n=1 Tax=Kroppenstedtia sanguinis TaxID=1380684 RepID=A0ABW4CC86_9BACL
MRFNLWNSLKISMTIIGTTIGAGFASGREIWEFFGSYGKESSPSIVLSTLLLFAASVIILQISWKEKTQHYSEVLVHVLGIRLARLFDYLVMISLVTSTLVMVAGSGATFQQWSGSFTMGIWVMAVAVIGILLFDLKGLMSMNTFLIPVMVIVLMVVCLQFLQGTGWVFATDEGGTPTLPVWPSAITYTAFNILSLLAVLSTMGKQVQHPVEIWVAGGISCLCLGLLASLYNYSLLRVENLISQYEIPLFALVRDYSDLWVATISLILWLAIYTTAVSNVHGLAFRLSDNLSLPPWIIGGGVMLLLVPVSRLGFSNLVTLLYPLYGVINLLILTMILLYPFTRET